MKTPVIVIDKDSNFTHKGGGNKTIEINARYYLLGHDGSYDVLDKALELQLLPAMVFANGTESECRDWILRNCEEPVKHSDAPWKYVSKLSGSENHRGFQIVAEDFRIAEVHPLDPDGQAGRANAALFSSAPDLLALAEQYHKSFPTKESGKLIAQAKGWI